MLDFSWNQWLSAVQQFVGVKQARKARRARTARIEVLEDRALLTANLPVAVSDVYSVNQDTAFNGTSVLANDTDLDNNVINGATLQSAPSHGTLTLAPDGTFNYIPNAGYVGSDSFTYFANDLANAEGSLTSGRVNLHVGTVNQLPVASPATINATTNTGFNGSLAGTDANGDSLTFAAGATAPTHGTVTINPNGTYLYTPANNFTGIDSFSFRTNDGTGNSVDSTVNVNVGAAGANVAPVLSKSTSVTAMNTAVHGSLSATDVNGNPVTFSAGSTAATGGTATINPDGTFTFTPNAGFTGIGTFSYRANDGIVNSTESIGRVHVGVQNAVPTVSSTAVSTNTNTAFHGTLTSNDANGDPLTFAAGTTAATHGSATINPDGTFVFTPTAGFTGPATFSYIASDSIGNSVSATQTVNVGAGLGQAPVGTATSISTNSNTSFSGTLAGTTSTGNPLTFAAGTTQASHGTVVINPNGTYTYTPANNFTGVDKFSFTANDGTLTSKDSNVTVHVGGTNTLPTVSNATFSTNTNTAFNGALTGLDADGDPLTFSAGTVAATNGTVQINPNGTFVFTPTNNFTGAGTFTFKANDSIGNSTDAVATVNVGAGLNQAPIGTAASITTSSGTAFSGNLHATDANGNNLTYAAGTTAASHGTVVVNSDGSYVYTPTNGYVGPDSFSFTANDGTVSSTNTLVNVTVTAANIAPTVTTGTGTTTVGTNFDGSLSPLGTDPENNALTYSAVTQPAHGTLALNPDGTFTYTPAAGFNGTDSFTFKANDGTSDSNIGTFNLTVNANTDLLTLNLAPNGTFGTSIRSTHPLDTGANLTNVDPSVNFANASITASFGQTGDSRHDKLLVTKDRNSNLQVRGKKILIDGNQVGTISGGKRGADLNINFNSSATQATVTSVLQRIGARTTKNSNSEARTVTVTLSAGNADASDTISVSKA
jgi:VCBS repeat-containing protein